MNLKYIGRVFVYCFEDRNLQEGVTKFRYRRDGAGCWGKRPVAEVDGGGWLPVSSKEFEELEEYFSWFSISWGEG